MKGKMGKAAVFISLFATLSSFCTAQAKYQLMGDRVHSSVESAHNLLTLHRGLYWLENKFLKPRLFPENIAAKKLLGIAYRLTKTVFVDDVVDHMAFLVQHEVFGHGYRYREFGYENNSYKLNLVFPYGNSSGMASRGTPDPERTVTAQENIAMVIGGSEANAILSNELRYKWLQRGKMHYREAILYLFAANDLTQYILRTKFKLRSAGGNDILSYLYSLNAYEGYQGEANYRLTVNDLARHTIVNFLNPFHYFSILTYLYTYLWSGKESSELPMFTLCSVRYLPSFRLGLTPFGTEFYLENFLVMAKRIVNLYFRYGIPTFHRFWGAGIHALNMIDSEYFSANACLDVWYQPELILGGKTVTAKGEGFGGALFVTVFYKLIRNDFIVSIFGQAGYKTAGFLQGEKLSAGATIRLGLSLTE